MGSENYTVRCASCPYQTEWSSKEEAQADAASHGGEMGHSVSVQHPPHSN